MTIATETMTVNIRVGMWTGHRLDKEASREVTDLKGADSDAARVNKHLVPKEMLNPMVSAASAMRNHLYKKTLPWKDNGDRLLVRKLFEEFMQEHSRLAEVFYTAVQKFIREDYPAARDQAEFRMGHLFNPADYPSPEAIKRKFYVHLEVDAVTEAGDFRVQLDEANLTAMRAEITRATEQRIATAMADVWERLADNMKNFSKLVTGDAQFRRATMDNLIEIVDMLPALNITGDERLTYLGEEIKSALRGVEPADLRKDRAVRQEVSTEVGRIMEAMDGFMKAMGGNE